MITHNWLLPHFHFSFWLSICRQATLPLDYLPQALAPSNMTQPEVLPTPNTACLGSSQIVACPNQWHGVKSGMLWDSKSRFCICSHSQSSWYGVYHGIRTYSLWFIAYWREAMIFALGETWEAKRNGETWMNLENMLNKRSWGRKGTY